MTQLAFTLSVLFATLGASAQDVTLPAPDPVELLAAGRYTQLDETLAAVQARYRRGEITDERLLAAFRPFYFLNRPGIGQRLDDWVREMSMSYVARLARGIHYKYEGLYPVVDTSVEYPVEARLRMRKKAYARAVEDLTASIELDDKPLLSYHHLMDEKDSLLWYSSNRRLLGKAIALDPKTLITRRKFLISKAPRSGGTFKAMDAYVEKCREESLPLALVAKLQYTVAVERAEVAFAHQRDYWVAQQQYAELMSADPEDPRPIQLYIAALQKQKKCDEIIDVAARLLAVDPRSDEALNNRGICFVRQGKFAEGLRDYRAAAALESVWAHKELARLLWNGNLVSKDRTSSLRHLRRAAEVGDAEANKEYERVTGESIHRKRPFYHSFAFCALVGIPLTAVGIITARRRRAEQATFTQRLEHSSAKFVRGAAGLTFFGGLLLALMIFPSNWYPFWPTLILTVFVAASIWETAGYLFVRHDIELAGIRYTTFAGSRRRLQWRDVQRIDYRAFSGHFVIEGKSGGFVRISEQLRNLHVLAGELIGRVPRELFDDTAAMLLDHIWRYHGREDWAPSDITAQEAAADIRIAMRGGMQSTVMALFSTDALPDVANVDPESLAALAQAQGMVPFHELENGQHLLHAYVDSNVPPGVEKYSLQLTRQSACLCTKTGGIAFGGVEWMCAGYHDRPEERFDARIPAGGYDVQTVYMMFPKGMVRAALCRRVGRISLMAMSVLPLAILTCAIGAIVLAIAGLWWLTACAAILVASGIVLRYRSPWCRTNEERTRMVLENFPAVVAQLRPRVGIC